MQVKNIYFNVKKVCINGYTYYRVQKQVNGQKITSTGKSKEEATEKFYDKMEDLKSKNNLNITTTVSRMNFDEFTRYYLSNVLEASHSVKGSTLQQYNSIYKNHIYNVNIFQIKLLDLRKKHFQTYFNNLSQSGLKNSFIKCIKIFISTVINYAIDEEFLMKNYCLGVRLPKEEFNNKYRFLEDSEINNILRHCKDYRLLIIIKIALSSGMRINEILAITPNDFDLKDNYIKVSKTLSYYDKRVVVCTPKSKASNRKVYLNQAMIDDIRNFIEYMEDFYIRQNKKFDENSLLFVDRIFKPIHYTNLTPKINSLFKECRIDATGFHILRHTYGSKLYQKGIDIKTISELLGHSSINVTSTVYIHIKDELKKKAIMNFNTNS